MQNGGPRRRSLNASTGFLRLRTIDPQRAMLSARLRPGASPFAPGAARLRRY